MAKNWTEYSRYKMHWNELYENVWLYYDVKRCLHVTCVDHDWLNVWFFSFEDNHKLGVTPIISPPTHLSCLILAIFTVLEFTKWPLLVFSLIFDQFQILNFPRKTLRTSEFVWFLLTVADRNTSLDVSLSFIWFSIMTVTEKVRGTFGFIPSGGQCPHPPPTVV